MAKIEWNESSELAPTAQAMEKFCLENGVDPDFISLPGHLVVFIEEAALEGLHAFLAHDVQREHGGVLVGKPYYDSVQKRHYTVIHNAIPAQETEGSPVHLQFTPETWDYISQIIEENYPDRAIVGWYHSHPGLGVFMSGTDSATQRAFYSRPWNVAVVVDPIAQRTGWFVGADCKPLTRLNVIPFRQQSPGAGWPVQPASELEREYLARTDFSNFRWLLPLAIIGTALLMALWRLVQQRSA